MYTCVLPFRKGRASSSFVPFQASLFSQAWWLASAYSHLSTPPSRPLLAKPFIVSAALSAVRWRLVVGRFETVSLTRVARRGCREPTRGRRFIPWPASFNRGMNGGRKVARRRRPRITENNGDWTWGRVDVARGSDGPSIEKARNGNSGWWTRPMGMESDESNLLDAVATILGLRGCHWNALARGCFLLFFFFFGKFAFVFFYFSFFVRVYSVRFPCWFKWIEMDKSDWSFMCMVGIEEWMEILVLIYE